MKTEKDILARISEIEQDEQFRAGQKSPAKVDINAPLALIQLSLESQRDALLWALGYPPRKRGE